MDCNVFVVANHAMLEDEVADMWLAGLSVEEATTQRISDGILDEMEGIDDDCIRCDLQDQFRLLSLLERYLEAPLRARDYCPFPVDQETLSRITEKYYEFNDNVIREILGKKLSARTRKDLDDVSERTHVRLKSCRRQFDNFRRIFKAVEELKGSLAQNIQKRFLLSESLARRYAASVFITNNRFETNKKRLNYLNFSDFVYCAQLMITHWSYSSIDCRLDDMDVDVDREFLQNLRFFRVLLDKDCVDELKIVVCKHLKGKISQLAMADLELSFKNLLRVLVNIAVDLNHTRDMRDFFIDVVDKFIEPCKQAKWVIQDVEILLNATTDCVRNCDAVARHQPSLQTTWDRYVNVVSGCIVKMYHD